jgi:formate dehydrogenase subunit gamma
MSLTISGALRRTPYSEAAARKIIDAELGREGPLLPILHALQREFGCVPSEAEPLIATTLNMSRAEVHGVVSFYHDFRRAPAGRHVLKICRAEACQSMGAEGASRRLMERLGVDWGGTTADGNITVEPVYCLGLCATAPSAMVDGEPRGRMNAEQLDALVAELAAEGKR